MLPGNLVSFAVTLMNGCISIKTCIANEFPKAGSNSNCEVVVAVSRSIIASVACQLAVKINTASELMSSSG